MKSASKREPTAYLHSRRAVLSPFLLAFAFFLLGRGLAAPVRGDVIPRGDGAPRGVRGGRLRRDPLPFPGIHVPGAPPRGGIALSNGGSGLASFPAEAAAPLFEEVVAEQGRFDDPGAARLGLRGGDPQRRPDARDPLPLRDGAAEGPGAVRGRRRHPGPGGRGGPVPASRAVLPRADRRGEGGNQDGVRTSSGASRRAPGEWRRADSSRARAARSRAELLLTEGKRLEAARDFPGAAAAWKRTRWTGSALPRRGQSRPRSRAPAARDDRRDAARGQGPVPAPFRRDRAQRRARRDRRSTAWTGRPGNWRKPCRWRLPPASEPPVRSGAAESLRVQLEGLRTLRQDLVYRELLPDEATRAAVVELLVGLLAADRTATLAAPEARLPPGLRLLSPEDVEEIVRRIEEVSLDGDGVDRLVEQLSARLDTLQNMGHPIQRYRQLVQLEKSQEEIHRLRERIKERRAAAVSAVETGRDGDVPPLLKDVGLFLNELDEIRTATAETREFTREHFDILRKRQEPAAGGGGSLRAIGPGDDRLRRRPGDLAFPRRAARWGKGAGRKRGNGRGRSCSPCARAVDRQLADALVGACRAVCGREPGEKARRESLAALGRAVSILSGGRLAREDAVRGGRRRRLGARGGKGRWEPYPGPAADEKEKELIARVLPLLPWRKTPGGPGGAALPRRRAADARRRMPGRRPPPGRYLEKYPASPLSAEIGVRLGHEALLAGDVAGASARYRAAADAGNPEASAVARYMLGWIRYQSGDSEGALRELARPLSDPVLPLRGCVPVRAGRPFARRPGGKGLLHRAAGIVPSGEGRDVRRKGLPFRRLGSRGEDAASPRGRRAFGTSRPGGSRRTRARRPSRWRPWRRCCAPGGRRRRYSRALTLRGKYGPASAWVRSQRPEVRERTAKELRGTVPGHGGEEVRRGDPHRRARSFSLSAAMIGEHLLVMGEKPSDGHRGDPPEARHRAPRLGEPERRGAAPR